MKIVIETDEFSSLESARVKLKRMQDQASRFKKLYPEDPTENLRVANYIESFDVTRIIGILHTREYVEHERRYAIEPIRGETNVNQA